MRREPLRGQGLPELRLAPAVKAEPIEVIDEDLVLRERGRKASPHEYTTEGVEVSTPSCSACSPSPTGRAAARASLSSSRVGSRKYLDKFGEWPPRDWANDVPRNPEARQPKPG